MNRTERKQRAKELAKAPHSLAFYATATGKINAIVNGSPQIAAEMLATLSATHQDIFDVIEAAYIEAKKRKENEK